MRKGPPSPSTTARGGLVFRASVSGRFFGGDRRHRLGRWGERIAAIWLRIHRYQILARNWKTPAGEIDIVARKGEILVVCEVKTRRGHYHLRVHHRQQQRLRRAARWLDNRFQTPNGVRIDIVEVRWPRQCWGWPRIKHHRDILDDDR